MAIRLFAIIAIHLLIIKVNPWAIDASVNLDINSIALPLLAKLYVAMVLSQSINNVMMEVNRMVMGAHHSALSKIILIVLLMR